MADIKTRMAALLGEDRLEEGHSAKDIGPELIAILGKAWKFGGTVVGDHRDGRTYERIGDAILEFVRENPEVIIKAFAPAAGIYRLKVKEAESDD